MMRLCVSILLAVVWLGGIATPPPSAAAPAPTPECRSQSAGERPNAGERPSPVADDLANCVIAQASPASLRLNVAYTYASALGNRNIWLGIDVLAAGNRLKWYGFRPVPITSSSGTATIEVTYGLNSPPKDALTTDQVELYMYVGGGQIFFRKVFALKHEWKP